MALQTTIPDAFRNRGPIPGKVIISLIAEEDSVEGVVVACGSTDQSVKRCDAADQPIGWSQSKLSSGNLADIHLFNPMWKADVDSGSAAISYGNILAPAADGKVAKASAVTPGIVLGIALSEAAASGQVLFVPITSAPDPITT